MGYVEGHARDQALLPPAAVEDCVAADHIEAVAARGLPGGDMAACERDGITPDRPRYGIAASNGRSPKDRFHHDAGEDAYHSRGPEILGRRRDTVEHPPGSIEPWMNQGAFPMRGLDRVRARFGPTALAHDLRRAISLAGVPGLIRAVQA